MIVVVRLSNAEADWYHVQKGRVIQRDAFGPEIFTRMKFQLIDGERKGIVFQERFITASVVVGLGVDEQVPPAIRDTKQLDPHPFGWRAVGCIQYVRGQKSHALKVIVLHLPLLKTISFILFIKL